jgi:hypothetical protein
MIPNKTEVLNLKTRKTQVPMMYLTLKLIKGLFGGFIYIYIYM